MNETLRESQETGIRLDPIETAEMARTEGGVLGVDDVIIGVCASLIAACIYTAVSDGATWLGSATASVSLTTTYDPSDPWYAYTPIN